MSERPQHRIRESTTGARPWPAVVAAIVLAAVLLVVLVAGFFR